MDGLTNNDGPASKGGYSYLFGRFRLHVGEEDRLTFFSDERKAPLSTAKTIILRMLLEKPGEPRTTSELRIAAFGPIAEDNLVHQTILSLRGNLNDKEIIQTLRGKGYCFRDPVEIRKDGQRPISHPVEPPEPISDDLSSVPASFVGLQEPVAPENSPQATADEPQGPKTGDESLSSATTVEPPKSTSTADAAPSGVDHSAHDNDAALQDSFGFIALIAAVLALPFLLFLADENLPGITKAIGFLQALMIIVGLGYDLTLSIGAQSTTDIDWQRAVIAVRQLRRSWRFVLASWFGLYITLALSIKIGPDHDFTSTGASLQIIATLLNNCSALMFFLCYRVLNRRTVIRVKGEHVEDLPWKVGLIVVGVAASLEVIMALAVGNSADRVRFVLVGADMLSGIGCGIAMALFISRLDSRVLTRSRLLPFVTIVLYFYAIIQPFFPFLKWPFLKWTALDYFVLPLMLLAFMLKGVMYFYVTQMFRHKRFLFYMIYAKPFYEKVESEWAKFKSDPRLL